METLEATRKLGFIKERMSNAYVLQGFFERLFEKKVLKEDEHTEYLRLLTFFQIPEDALKNDTTMVVNLKKLNFVKDHAVPHKALMV